MLVPPLCWSCQAPARRREPLCTRCRLRMRRLAADCAVIGGLRVWAPLAYSGPARELVRALKFRGARGVADFMAAQIVANAPDGLLHGAYVPVPLHPSRLRSRGYNQAALIATALSRRTGMPVSDCLARAGSPDTQVGRARAERRAGPAGAVHVGTALARAARAESIAGHALLVDDVVTTGATLRACAAALASAGCAEVAAVVFARTLGR